MAVITEEAARRMADSGEQTVHLRAGDIITPAARSYLYEQHIAIKEPPPFEKAGETAKGDFTTLFGGHLTEKPEQMTHLRGDVLVFKDHPRIILRGKIDSLEAAIILVQLRAREKGDETLVGELEEIIAFIRQLLRAEVSGEPVAEIKLLGLDAADMREQSHHPSQYFGLKHFLPGVQYGEMVARLNGLRTLSRETELAAFAAFKGAHGEMTRVDIIRGFNRLSSLFWILMFKERRKGKE